MKKWGVLWIMVSSVILSLRFAVDFIQITFQDESMEGYAQFLYVLMFDLSVIVPVILLLLSKNSFLIGWSFLTVVSLNLSVGLGWQWGSFLGFMFTLFSLLALVANRKELRA